MATKFGVPSQSESLDHLSQRCSELEEDLRRMAVTADRYRRKAVSRAKQIRLFKERRSISPTSSVSSTSSDTVIVQEPEHPVTQFVSEELETADQLYHMRRPLGGSGTRGCPAEVNAFGHYSDVQLEVLFPDAADSSGVYFKVEVLKHLGLRST